MHLDEIYLETSIWMIVKRSCEINRLLFKNDRLLFKNISNEVTD